MNIRICKEFKVIPDTYICTYDMLKDKLVHLYIASNKWDTMEIELCDLIPNRVLPYMMIVCKNVRVRVLDEKITSYSLKLLIEMFPERAGELRRASMLNRLDGVLETF